MYLGIEERKTIYWSRSHIAPRRQETLPDALHISNENLRQLLQEFAPLFNNPPQQCTTASTKHTIRLKQDKIINQKPYAMTPHKKQIMYQQIEEMLQSGVIEPSNSNYSSPPVIIERADKKPRFCIDYRQLNELTEDEPSVLPNINDTIKDLGRAKIFSLLDLKAGYWQIPMEENSKQYTAFSTPDGALFQFNVMPFGLKGAPATFQKFVTHEILTGYLHNFAKVYLDDILVYSETEEEHFQHLRLVLERLEIHRLHVSPEKCVFMTDKIEYLGHTIEDDFIKPQTKHISAVVNFPTPTSKKQLQSLLGTLNWIREYIPRAAELTAPLQNLLRKNTRFRWTPEHSVALENIKTAVQQPLKLHRPDFNRQFILQTDGSMKGLGAVLYQEDEAGNKHIISYASSSLTDAEKRYHINEIETLSIVWAIKKYRQLIEDRHFVLRTDSKTLTWLARFKDSKAKLTRWALLLSEYDFEVQHIPGKENNLPDLLSRSPDENQERTALDENRMLPPEYDHQTTEIQVNLLNFDQLHQLVLQRQQESRRIQQEIELWELLKTAGVRQKKDQKFFENHTVQDGHLYRKFPQGNLLIVPRSIQRKITYYHHDTEETGHPGHQETLRKIQQHYYWKNIAKSTAHYVRNCIVCTAIKSRQHQLAAPLRPNQAETPWHTVSVDVAGPYPETPTGKKYIIVATDIYSKWVEARAVPEADALTITLFLREEIVSRYGAPKRLITDRGAVFHCTLMARYCREHDIEHQMTAVEHQRANPVERKVQDLKKVLRFLTRSRRPHTWEVQLPKALFILRTRRNAATGETPSKVLLGYELPRVGEWRVPEYLERRRNNTRPNKETIAERQHKYAQKYAPPRPNPLHYEVGEFVFAKKTQNEHNPFAPLWSGPYRITRRISPEIYELEKRGLLTQLHIDCIRKTPPGNGNAEASEDSDTDFPTDREDSDSSSSEEDIDE